MAKTEKSAFTPQAMHERRQPARRHKDKMQPLLDEVFKYAIPFRDTTADTGDGEPRVDQVFDHTAIDAAMRFAGKLQQDIWPAGQENFTLDPGAVVLDPNERQQLKQILQPVQKICQSFFDNGWDMAFHEMAIDLVAGTGAMLMNPADTDEPRLWNPISVPIAEIMLENGPHNRISGIFWDRKMTGRVILDTYPQGNFSEAFRKDIEERPEGEHDVKIDTVFDSNAKEWVTIVWVQKSDSEIETTRNKECPWLVPRYYRVPGETFGRGVGMLAMPEIKTLNTAKHLQLMAASIAMMGIYTAVDDGVFNPDLAPVEPGAFWKVARNGGALGPSVTRFPDPRLDLSNLVIRDMQMAVKSTMMDQQLPPDAGGVRSATEIIERVKRLSSDYLGAFGRLVEEIHVPAVRRVIELAFNRQLITTDIGIDQLLVKLSVKSPIAIARETARVERIVQWLEMVLALTNAAGAPQMVNQIAKLEQALLEIATIMNIPDNLLVSEQEREDMRAADEEQAAAAMAMAAAAAEGEPMA